MSDSHRIPRVSSDFSIERILAEDGEKIPRQIASSAIDCDRVASPGAKIPAESPPRRESPVEFSNFGRSLKIESSELTWLRCTRYRPPKLPRKPSGKCGKRKPGAHPRIPFTTIQLQTLEEKYRKTAYLSRRDVQQLSSTLRLPQSRVKIWFQNRRARDRRESGISGGSGIMADDGSLLRTSRSSPTEKFVSTSNSS